MQLVIKLEILVAKFDEDEALKLGNYFLKLSRIS